MAYTSFRDISIVLSGGTSNTDANLALGGSPSANPVLNGTLNNLFDDVTPVQARDGHEDYRCIYFFNDGDTPVHNVKLWIVGDEEDGSFMELGIVGRDEIQRLTLDGVQALSGGSIKLSYDSVEFTLPYYSDLGTWSVNFANILNSLTDSSNRSLLQEATVTAQYSTSAVVIFDIQYNGRDSRRDHPTIQIVENNLIPAGINASITTIQQGSPINTVAPTILSEVNPPGGVGFFAPTEQSPISLPRLGTGDGFPLWIKRVTLPNTDPKERDGFSIRFYAESFES